MLFDELSLSVLSTEDIIKKFCHDLVKQQVLKYCYKACSSSAYVGRKQQISQN